MSQDNNEISPLKLKDKRLVKILNDNLNHHNFQYQEGLNVDSLPFNPSGNCQSGGLYFCEFKDFTLFLSYGTLIADVMLPDDARVYHEAQKYKADKIILQNIRSIANLPEWRDPEWQLAAVKQNGDAIQFITNPSFEIQLAAVKRCGNLIRFIPNPSFEIQLAAMKQNGDAIQYISNPSFEIQLAAVKQNGYAIQYISNPSFEIQLAAVEQKQSFY